ncbi:MAG: D-alanyl-D-alanine carboxypeptidase/D-alanyl-D-alanine-endopeptidase [Pseudomonadota bacterium]
MGDFLSRAQGVMHRLRRFVTLALVAALTPMATQGQQAQPAIVFPGLEGLRYGLSVTDLQGNVLLAHRANERFMPASNAKLFVTAAALASEAELTALAPALRVYLVHGPEGPPDLVLVGRGDPTIGAGSECDARCIETLARAVAAANITEVGDIVGDDRWFADERTPLGWSWDDLKFGHGTAVSALSVNENVVPLRVSPGRTPGAPVSASWPDSGAAYFDLEIDAQTGARGSPWALRIQRNTGDQTARLYGDVPVRSRTVSLRLGVDNPAHLAAWYFRNALAAEGVAISGTLRTQHRPLQYEDEPRPEDPTDPESAMRCLIDAMPPPRGTLIASLPPAPLGEIVAEINRDSQNLYAEVLLRQLGHVAGRGSSFCGQLQIQTFLDGVGIARTAYDIADGSGLSNYNRATPAAITALLRHAATAPWGEMFRLSLPMGGGADGSLRFRFRGTPLEGKIFAKTGTLNHVDALSGYMEARSGRVLAFSIIVNDRPLSTPSARRQIDAVLLDIASRY